MKTTSDGELLGVLLCQLIGEPLTRTWSLKLSKLSQKLEELCDSGTPETEEAMRLAYLEMGTLIQSMSDRLMTLGHILKASSKTGGTEADEYEQATFSDDL